MPTNAKADYGLDAPHLVRGFFLGGAVLLFGSMLLRNGFVLPAAIRGLSISATWMGATFLPTGAMMWLSSRVGKLRARNALLDRLQLANDARVLDVGCGHGLLLIGAATRCRQGTAVGLDLWSQTDQGANSREATIENARREGVTDRVDVKDGDMRALPFPDASFDAVVSSLAIHNVSSRADRRTAIHEIVRVLKPGGCVGIMDIAHIAEYAADLRVAGMEVQSTGFTPWIFPPTRVLTGRKG